MKKIALIIAVAVLGFAPAGVARAELCEKCKGKMYIASVGKCVVCGGFTGSGAHKLCRKCSAKLGQCEHCRAKLHAGKPLPQKPKDKPILIKPKPGPTPIRPIMIDPGRRLQPGTHVSAKWKYVYTIRAKGSKSEGHYGKLFYDGKEVPKPAGINDRYKTPWGLLYWVGDPRVPWGRHGWMPPGKRTGARLGKLLPSPAKAAPSYLRAIELDESANGKTISAIIGQQIIISLKGAPVPGRMWRPAKLKGDAIEQVGQMKFVPDARPRPIFVPDRRHQQPGPVPVPNARPQPMPGRGLVAHTMGGPGKYVFTFRAVKAGKANVTIKGRAHGRQRRPVRTFTLTVNVKADPTAERVKKLKANLDKFAMTISYQGRGPTRRAPRWCRHITLSVPPALVPRTPSWQVRRISKEQAAKIIDRLAKTGFLARANPRSPIRTLGVFYALAVRLRKPGPGSPMLMDIVENIGWGPQLLKRMEGMGLQKVLEGDAAKAFDFLIEPIREKFGKEGEKPAPAKVEKIDTKKSGKYTSGKWKYVYTLHTFRIDGSRGEGYYGKLFYNGKEVPKPAGINDRYKTPWGVLLWAGDQRVRWGGHGWMPPEIMTASIGGKLLPSPDPAKAAPAEIYKIDLKKSGTYKSGKWEYRYEVKRYDTRRGYWGRLFYDGKTVVPNNPGLKGVNDYYRTPWGRMYWTGYRQSSTGPHDWMPYPSPYSKRKGRLLPSPEKAASKKPRPAKIDTKKSGKYASGKWKYVYNIRAAGTRSERRFSSLTYGGEQIVGAKTLDRMKTPWGMMQYYQMSYTRGWMLELNRGTPIDPTKGRLLPSPAKAGTSQIAPLELDVSHNGKTVSAVIDQAIVISLKGNPTTGYGWTVGNIEGDAVGQIGTMKYVSDTPARLGPAGRGRLIMHRVGGGGKCVFTFRTVKAGKSTLTLEYKRGWEKKPPHKTFTLTVNVK